MNFRPCPREAEVKALLQSGHWPQACPAELRTHAAACTACANQVLLAQTFRGARDASASAAQLPPPGVLWWRAQLRRRNTAVERIGKPILGAQIFAVFLLVAAGVVLSQAGFGLRWLATLAQSPIFHLSSLWPTSTFQSMNADALNWLKFDLTLPYLIPAVAVLALLSGLVLYLAAEKQ